MIIVNARFLTQPISGVQRYGIEISKELKKLYKDEILFLTPKNILHHEVAKEINARIIGRHIGYIWEQWDLPLYLKSVGKPLLLNFGNIAPLLYRNQITTIHDIMFYNYNGYSFKKIVWAYRLLVPQVVRRSIHILTVSEYSKNEICNKFHLSLSDVSVIYSSYNKKMSKIINCDSLRIQHYFFTLSSCTETKNLILLLQAFTLLAYEYPDIKLYIAGKVSEKQFLERGWGKYLQNSNIVLLGRVSDEELIKYYSNAIAFVFPSLSEGFGLPPMEAQGCGCPAILSNATCLPEIYKNSVLYCDPHDEKDLSDKMKMVIEDKTLAEMLVNKGFENMHYFSWEKNAYKLSKIIEQYI